MENNPYYEKLMEQVRKNIELSNELEKYKKLYSISKAYMRFKNDLDSFNREYQNNYKLLRFLIPKLEELKSIYNKRLLLNPNIPNIKLSLEEKTLIINETRTILSKIKELKMPIQKDFFIDVPIKKTQIVQSDKTNKKYMIVKKKRPKLTKEQIELIRKNIKDYRKSLGKLKILYGGCFK